MFIDNEIGFDVAPFGGAELSQRLPELLRSSERSPVFAFLDL